MNWILDGTIYELAPLLGYRPLASRLQRFYFCLLADQQAAFSPMKRKTAATTPSILGFDRLASRIKNPSAKAKPHWVLLKTHTLCWRGGKNVWMMHGMIYEDYMVDLAGKYSVKFISERCTVTNTN